MATLDSNIILQGQPVNLLGAMQAGQGLAAQRMEFDRQREYQNMLAQNGAGILAGDTSSLNALAGYDPAAAMNIQNTRQSMQHSQRKMDMLSAEEARSVAEYKRKLSAEQAAAEAAKIEQGVKMGLSARSPQEWDAMMAQVSPDLVGMFDQREMLANRYISIADILKQGEGPEWRPATPEEAAARGAQAGQINTKTGKFDRTPLDSGMSVETGPDGQLRVLSGPGVQNGTSKPFTEAQSKDNVYVTRARGALEVLEPMASALTSRGDLALDYVPFGLGREMQGGNFQVAQQAGKEFLQAILRKDTGAAITSQEEASYGVTYLPQPGDGPRVLEAKKDARLRAVAAIESGMSPAQILARDNALVQAAREGAGAQTPNKATPEAGAVIDGFRFKGGDPADKNNWEPAQ